MRASKSVAQMVEWMPSDTYGEDGRPETPASAPGGTPFGAGPRSGPTSGPRQQSSDSPGRKRRKKTSGGVVSRTRGRPEFVHNCNYSIIKNLNSQHGPCFLIENVPKPRLFSEVIHAVWSQLMTLNANLAPLALVEQDFVKQEGGEL